MHFRAQAHLFLDQFHNAPKEREHVYAWLAANFGDATGMTNGRDGFIHIRYLDQEGCDTVISLLAELLARHEGSLVEAKKEIEQWSQQRKLLRKLTIKDYDKSSPTNVSSSKAKQKAKVKEELPETKSLDQFKVIDLKDNLLADLRRIKENPSQLSHNDQYMVMLMQDIFFRKKKITTGSSLEGQISFFIEDNSLLQDLCVACLLAKEEEEVSPKQDQTASSSVSFIIEPAESVAEKLLESDRAFGEKEQKEVRKSLREWNKSVSVSSQKSDISTTIPTYFSGPSSSSSTDNNTVKKIITPEAKKPIDLDSQILQQKIERVFLAAQKRKKKEQKIEEVIGIIIRMDQNLRTPSLTTKYLQDTIEICDAISRQETKSMTGEIVKEGTVDVKELCKTMLKWKEKRNKFSHQDAMRMAELQQKVMGAGHLVSASVYTEGLDEVTANLVHEVGGIHLPAFYWNIKFPEDEKTVVVPWFSFIYLARPVDLTKLKDKLSAFQITSLLCEKVEGWQPFAKSNPELFTEFEEKNPYGKEILRKVIEKVNLPISLCEKEDGVSNKKFLFLLHRNMGSPFLISPKEDKAVNTNPKYAQAGITKKLEYVLGKRKLRIAYVDVRGDNITLIDNLGSADKDDKKGKGELRNSNQSRAR
jgi:hypothetical protein